MKTRKRLTALLLSLAIGVTFMPAFFYEAAVDVYADSCAFAVHVNAGDHGKFYDDGNTLWSITNNRTIASNYVVDDSHNSTWLVGYEIPAISNDIFTGTSPAAYDVVLVADDGWMFDGWYDQATGGNKVNFSKFVSTEQTMYAHWKQVANTVSFDAGEHGCYVTKNDSEWVVSNNTFATCPADAPWLIAYEIPFVPKEAFEEGEGVVDAFSQNGIVLVAIDKNYVFDGWYDAKQGGNKVNFANTELSASNCKFYAHWSKNTESGRPHEEWEFDMGNDNDLKLMLAEFTAYPNDSIPILGSKTTTYEKFKDMTLTNSDFNKGVAYCYDCGLEQTVKLSTKNVKYDGEAHAATVDYTKWNKESYALPDLELGYINFSKIEETYKKIKEIMDYINDSEDWSEGDLNYLDISDPADVDEIINVFEMDDVYLQWCTDEEAPTAPGKYIAVLTNQDEENWAPFGPMDFVVAASLFVIEPTKDACPHDDWEYKGLSGSFGSILVDLINVAMDNSNNIDLPPLELILGDLFGGLPSSVISAEDLFKLLDEEVTCERYDALAAPLNDLLNNIVAECETCDGTHYLQVKAPADTNYSGQAKPVVIDETKWPEGKGLKNEYKTYYLQLDKLVESIETIVKKVDDLNSFTAEFDPMEGPTPEQLAQVMKMVIKIIYEGLTDIISSCSTNAPVNPGKYVAFTAFVNEDGSCLDLKPLKKLIEEEQIIISGPVELLKLQDSLKQVVNNALAFTTTFYSIKPYSAPAGGGGAVVDPVPAPAISNVSEAVEYVNANIPDKLTKYDAAYVDMAKKELDRFANANLSSEQETAYNAAKEKVAVATAKLAVMNNQVSGSKLKAGKGKITVKWSEATNSNVAGYKVYRSTSKNGNYKLVKTTTGKKFVNKKLKKGKKYYYKVRGFAKIGGQTVYTKYSTVKSVKVK